MSVLSEKLFQEILLARQRVYEVGKPTPLQKLNLRDIPAAVYAKREDLGPIKAYKWRGAYNCMAALTPEQRAGGVVAASAGNHAQGVALAARHLNCKARIFMPLSTPEVKQREVRRHGGDHVEIVLHGDSYDAASAAAHAYARQNHLTFVHPYDDLVTMGGQGTLADEVVMSGKGPFDRVYVQIGGGGMAAATACWIKKFWPQAKVIGVEGVDQASMKLAIEKGERTSLEYVDVFCDGTAVRTAGENTFPLCRELIDEFVTVTNDEVCHAMRAMWDSSRVVPEASGAMGLAAFMQQWQHGEIGEKEKCLVIISGANMDFSQMGLVARMAGIDGCETRYLRIPMETKRGQILKYLRSVPEGATIVDVQYGRVAGEIQYPVFGVAGTQSDFEIIEQRLAEKGLKAEDVSNDEDVRFRMIHYDAERLSHPVFVQIEFSERPGAFLDFMAAIGDLASLCYFNYVYSGERVGRALMGMEFESREDRDICRARADKLAGTVIQGIHEVSPAARKRILDTMSPSSC